MSSLGALPEDPVALLMAIDQVNQRRAALEEERAARAFQQQRLSRQDALAEQQFEMQRKELQRQQQEQQILGQLQAMGDMVAREDAARQYLQQGQLSPGAYTQMRKDEAALRAADIGAEQAQAGLYKSGIEAEKAELGLEREKFNQQLQDRKFQADQLGRGLRALRDKNGKLMPSKWPLIRNELIKSGLPGADELPESFSSDMELQDFVDGQTEYLEVQNEFLAEPEKAYELSKRQQEIQALVQRGVISEEEGNRQLRAHGYLALKKERRDATPVPGSDKLQDLEFAKDQGFISESLYKKLGAAALASAGAAVSMAKEFGLTTAMKTKIQNDDYSYRSLTGLSKEINDVAGDERTLERMFTSMGKMSAWSKAKAERHFGRGAVDPEFLSKFTQIKLQVKHVVDTIRAQTTGQAASDQELRRLLSRLNESQSYTEFKSSMHAIIRASQIKRDAGMQMIAEHKDQLRKAGSGKQASVYDNLVDQAMREQGVLGMTEDQAEAQAFQELGNTGASDEQIIQRMNELMGR